jgi:hypothetical protein
MVGAVGDQRLLGQMQALLQERVEMVALQLHLLYQALL